MKKVLFRNTSLFLIVLVCFLLTGCGEKEEAVTATSYDDINDLPDGGYYILQDGIYYAPYFGQTSFATNSVVTTPDADRVAWFGIDYQEIPTMYKNDTVVLRSSTLFKEEIWLERFEDIGYTIGICGMEQRDSGRYMFETDTEAFNIDLQSDAGVLCEMGEQTAVLDKIGGVELRSGNISRAGTIIGLTQGKVYNCDIYFGTELTEYKLTADARAMVSMESIQIQQYTYDRSKTITFQFPTNLQSGYYSINGYGIVRYINGNFGTFNEEMDINIPNDMKNLYSEPNEEQGQQNFEDYLEDLQEEKFTLYEDSIVTVTVNYHETDKKAAPPTVKVVGDLCAYTLSRDETTDNQLIGTYELPEGNYTIKLLDLAGRAYSYRVTKNTQSDSETEEVRENEAQKEDALSDIHSESSKAPETQTKKQTESIKEKSSTDIVHKEESKKSDGR